MKEKGETKRIWFFVLGLFVLGLLLYFKSWDVKSDFIVTYLGKEELHILNFSPARGGVNWYVILGETNLFIPGGYGWYPVSSLSGLIEQEKKEDLLKDVLFLNFGLISNSEVSGSFVKTEKIREVLKRSKIGIVDRLKLRFFMDRNYNSGLKIVKSGLKEIEEGKISMDKDWWLGSWIRDLADTSIVIEGLTVEILNGGAATGAALKVGKIISMMGFEVESLANTEDGGECRVEYKKEVLGTNSFFKLKKALEKKLKFEEKEGLETDFRLILKKDCFLDISE